ncbi:MAG: 5'-nucleotidase C-terminal domain-containing protein [Spirochaetales bacterium]|nr:5'-nucleotidase C-terminal domain-containing protein [Spirochaetales bacterium]
MSFLKKTMALIAVSLFFTGILFSAEYELKVLHTNDHHGHPIAFYDYPSDGQGGLAARATYVAQMRASNKNVLVLDAGDFNTGRPESTFFKAEPDILGYNYIGYDALSMGNHEFDNDWASMQKQIADSKFPWINANIKKNGSTLDNVKPYIIKEYNGFKVAVFGLLTKETVETGNPDYVKGLTFEDEVATAKKLVPELRKKADIVIALVHMGLYDNDLEGSRKLAANVPGIDLIIDGHSHTMIKEPVVVKGIPIVQARHWGLYMGNGTLKIKDGKVVSFNWQLDPINVKNKEGFVGTEYKEDQVLLGKLAPFNEKVTAVLSEVIGTATDVFLNDNTRKEETAIGDIVSDSQEWFMEKMGMDVDFAFQNGGGIRATLPAGTIQKQTVYEILPFDNSIAVITLTGNDVIALFDKAATNIGAGSMPQVSKGVKVTINAETKKVEKLTIDGKPVDPVKNYKIATNSYLAAGGDGYSVFKNGTNYYDSSLMQRDAFIDYVIFLGGKISPKTDGRITIK